LLDRIHESSATIEGLLAILDRGGYFRPPDPDQRAVFKAEVTRFTSSNGFRFIVLPDENANIVRLDVRYHVGAMADPPGKAGLAHLVEHMTFQTRLKTSGGELTVAQIVAGVAQRSNATTTLDSTHYMLQVAPDQLETMFVLEVARLRLGCATWDDATFVREREIVRNEIREDHAEAWGDVPRLLHEAAYPSGHPYRRTVGGTDATIASITLQDACAFVQRHYRPGNVTIVAAGRVSEAEIKQLAADHLGRFPPAELTPPPAVATAPHGNGKIVATHELDIDQPLLVGLFPLPPEGTHDHRLVEIAAGDIGFRLASLATRARWGHSPSVAEIGGARAPLLAVGVSFHDLDDTDAARSAIETAMRRAVNTTRFIDNERWRTPIWLAYKERLIAGFESFHDRPQMFADYEQFDPEPMFVIGRLKELDVVASDDIHRLGARHLEPDRGTYVLFKPRPGARVAGAGSFAYGASPHDGSAWRFPVDPADADEPQPLPPEPVRPLPIVEHRLDNGLRVLMWPHGTAPLTYGRLVVAAGSADEPAARAGIASVAGGSVGFDVTQMSWRELSVDMDHVVEILSLFLRHGAVQNYEIWREERKKLLDRPHAKLRAEYDSAFRAALYGADHPYSKGVITAASLPNIDGDDVAAFERTYHVAGNATLVLAGMFDPELAKKHIRFQFGHLARKARAPRTIPPVAPRRERVVVARHGDAESPVVEVDLAFTGAAGIDRLYPARLILEHLLAARLRALREGLAVTYGMGASFTPRIGPGEWRISGQLDGTRAAGAVSGRPR
jgi:zinc protease